MFYDTNQFLKKTKRRILYKEMIKKNYFKTLKTIIDKMK